MTILYKYSILDKDIVVPNNSEHKEEGAMTKEKIYFRGEPFTSRVVSRGNELTTCVPVVYDVPDSCGVGIFYGDGSGHYWGFYFPRNLIAAWRATEVLRRLDPLCGDALCAAYYTGVRNPRKSDIVAYVEPTIAIIGQTAYDEIITMPVPESIIRSILDNHVRGDFYSPDLSPITDEVRAGTIQWRHEFYDFGVTHPDAEDLEKRDRKERRKKLERFETLLASYATFRFLSRQGKEMRCVEDFLITLAYGNDAGRRYSDHGLVALAGVMGELTMISSLIASPPLCIPVSYGMYETWMDVPKKQAICLSARWLASVAKRSRFVFWKRRERFTFDSAVELIRNALGRYLPPTP